MKVISIDNINELDSQTVATIGFFDGLHKGHRFLIDLVKKKANEKGMKSAVVTFPVHPRFVMNSEYKPVMLSTYEEKLKLFEETGIDYVFSINFTGEIASLSAYDFMNNILKKLFKVSALIIGYDHRFGHNRLEGFEDYCRYGKELGIEVIKADEFIAGRYEISSSAIRRYLMAGEIRKATFSLGREYNITGKVVDGYHVGRKIGFPTANIQPSTEKLIPSNGVYAVRVSVKGREYKGMLNIGNRPTIGNGPARSIEVHIFDFNESIYNETLTFTFTEHIRNEHKFENLESLIEQLKKDEKYIRTLYFIKENENRNPKEVALAASSNKNIDGIFAASQINGRNIAKSKIPSWAEIEGIIYPKHLSLEQCSSEETARFKATLASGNSMADLTGGMGVDCFFLSSNFKEADYVERQEELCSIMNHNKSLLNADNLSVHNGDAVSYLKDMKHVDLIYIDPARRDVNGGKTVLISQCEPDISQINDLLLEKASKVMVKLSPMFDLEQAKREVNGIESIYIISANNECKELLLVLSKESNEAEPYIYCINLTKESVSKFGYTISDEKKSIPTYAGKPEKYLYEPNASIMKAGAYKSLGNAFGLKKISVNSHLYTSENLETGFPGRTFEIINTYDFSKKSIKQLTSDCPKANLTVRNFPGTVNELRKRLKITEGGDDYLFATTLSDNTKVILRCRKV